VTRGSDDHYFSIDLIKLTLIIGAMLVLNALADPTRQRIVEMLAERELSAGAIADRFDVSPPAISQHLKVLKDAHLVRVRADAQRRIYALDPAGFDELEQWMTRIRRYWRGSLDALERVLKEEDRKSGKSKR
jgi:DNA-binding transcriptional ArsR family regulator